MVKRLFLLLLFPVSLFAQYKSNDAGLWSTFSVKKELNFRNYLVIDQEMRLRENYTSLNLFYTNLGYGYRFTKEFKVEVVYRGIQKYVFNYFSFRHRIMVDMSYKKKFNALVLTNRFRYQAEVRDVLTSADGKHPEQYLRHKVDIAYDNDQRLIPSYSCELRYQVNVPRGGAPELNGQIHRIRNSVGLDYKIKKNNTLGIYYLTQHEFNIKSPENIYITGIQYSITLE